MLQSTRGLREDYEGELEGTRSFLSVIENGWDEEGSEWHRELRGKISKGKRRERTCLDRQKEKKKVWSGKEII